jgi:ABC-type sugar transport system ATPase subunit
MNGKTILQLDGITKLYPGSVALYNARMVVKEGEVHGIIGKNGAGKSTLVNVVSGITAPTGGEIRLGGENGEVVHSLTRQRARRAGIAIVTQEPEVVPDFTVAENLFFPEYFRGPGGRIRWRGMGEEAGRIMEMAQLKVNPHAKMSDLSLSEQQLVLVAKAFYVERAKIIILDEVTASLSSRDGAFLYEIINMQKREGKAILFISHHMGEILEICDRVTVLRDGKTVATEERGALDQRKLAHFIVGEEAGSLESGQAPKAQDASRPESRAAAGVLGVTSGGARVRTAGGAPARIGLGGKEREGARGTGDGVVLAVSKLTRAGAFQDLSLVLRRGEVLGIAGLRGSGRTEILKAIAGIDRVDGGSVAVEGRERVFRSPSEAFAGGVVYLPENRDKEGLIEMQSVRVNLSLSSLRRLTRGAFIDRRAERRVIDGLIDMLSIMTPSPEQEVRNLSGGNRQKVVVGKIFASRPVVYLLDEPTRGIDISAKKSILSTIRECLAETSGVIMTAPGLEDLVSVCDRILILYRGSVVDEFTRGEFQERELYLAIHGTGRKKTGGAGPSGVLSNGAGPSDGRSGELPGGPPGANRLKE